MKKYLKKILNFYNKNLKQNKPIEITLQPDFKSILESNPLDEHKHLEYAMYCLENKMNNLAIAEFKTALSLGATIHGVQDLIDTATSQAIPLTKIEHNQYYRFKTLSDKIKELANKDNYSVLDIGGGHGILSQFIPKADYCLVEPDVNGISGVQLPFEDNSFDFVVACHVLEHITSTEREIFLNQLTSKAKKAVILLNPFEDNTISNEDINNFFINITNAKWAKEHLECGLPKLEDVINYSKMQNLEYSIEPNGSLTTTTAMVLVDYLSDTHHHLEHQEISEFFNTRFNTILNNEEHPTAYLITIFTN